jgi:hypothetical protein
MGISHNLLKAGHVLLTYCLEERRQHVWCTAENHATSYAPALIVAVTTALDAWLNELLEFARYTSGLTEAELAGVIDIGTVPEKYERAAELLFGERVRPSTDLRQLSKLRNEIVHFLPYAQIITGQTVPGWLQYLDQKDLLISSNQNVDFHFSQKLCSYALAYWACETVQKAAERFAEVAQRTGREQFTATTQNFCVTAGIHSPEELKDYDAQHGIKLTQ